MWTFWICSLWNQPVKLNFAPIVISNHVHLCPLHITTRENQYVWHKIKYTIFYVSKHEQFSGANINHQMINRKKQNQMIGKILRENNWCGRIRNPIDYNRKFGNCKYLEMQLKRLCINNRYIRDFPLLGPEKKNRIKLLSTND